MSLSSTQLQYSFSHFKIQIDDLSNSVATKVLYLLSSIILCITLHQPLSPMRHLQFSSVTQLCPTLCDPMDCGTPDLSPSPTPGVYSNTYPLSQWCHPTISSFVIPFFSHLQSFPASGSFPMNQFFASSGQSIGVSASASVLPMNIQDWFPLEWTGWISFLSKGLSRVFSNTMFKSISSPVLRFLYSPTLNPYDYWKNHSFD